MSRRPAKPRETLNERQERFAEGIARGLPAGRAAREAGYASASAYSQGHELLKNPKIAARVATLREGRLKGYALTAARIDQERARIAKLDPRKLVDEETGERIPLHELDEDTARAIAGVKFKIAKVVRGKNAKAAAIGLGLEPDQEREVLEVQLGTVEVKFSDKNGALADADTVLGRRKTKLEVKAELSHEALLILAQKVRQKRLADARVGRAAGSGKPAAPAGGRAA